MVRRHELPPEQLNLLTTDEQIAPADTSATPDEEAVFNDVESRARNLLFAVNALDGVAKRKGLVKAVEKIPGKKEQLAAQYAGRQPIDGKSANTDKTFEQVVLPGAIEHNKEKIKSVDELFDEAFGDYELAKEKALQEFTPAERAELEISGKYPDREEFRAAFRAKMLDSRKVGDPSKTRRSTKGLQNRKKMRSEMSQTLHRIHETRSNQEAA